MSTRSTAARCYPWTGVPLARHSHHACPSIPLRPHSPPPAPTSDGRALSAEGRQVDVLVVTAAFVGMKPLQRHRLVHRSLESLLQADRLHSIKIRTMTPEQWEKRAVGAATGIQLPR